jgi:putative peptidoglycan lipid II flippase
MAAFRKTVSAGIRLILFLTVPSSVYIIVLARPIVQFLFQSGKFKGTDAELTATLLVAYTFGLFAWSAQAIVARGFYAQKDSRTPVVIGTIVTAIFVLANFLVLKTVGVGPANSLKSAYGLATVTSFAAILNTGVLVVLLRNKIGGIDGIRLAVGTLKIVVASVAFAVVCRATLAFLQAHPLRGGLASLKVTSATNLLVCAVAGILVYAAMTFALKMDEAKMLISAIRRRKPQID